VEVVVVTLVLLLLHRVKGIPEDLVAEAALTVVVRVVLGLLVKETTVGPGY
jgi:hypothetical protein